MPNDGRRKARGTDGLGSIKAEGMLEVKQTGREELFRVKERWGQGWADGHMGRR